jgi:membrane-associated HD superfamily phosphohydrolase
VSKFALPALVLGILALFSYLVASQSSDAPAGPLAVQSEPSKNVSDPAKPEQQEQTSGTGTNVQSADSALERLSQDTKTNSDTIATLRSDLLKQIEDLKSSNDKAAQGMLGQINALRSEQAKVLEDGKETENKATQGMRAEIAATQTKLAAQADSIQKASTNRLDALGQRVDALGKDFDDVKHAFEEDQRNMPSVSPGAALVVALAALIVGPFLAYQFMANQLAGLRQPAANATTPHPNTTKAEQEFSRSHPSQQYREEASHHEAPSPSEQYGAQHEADAGQEIAHEPEKT